MQEKYMDQLDNLNKLAADIGTDIRLVQGAGGNISFKDKNILWVKASGTWLAEAMKRQIFVCLDLLAVREALKAGNEDFSTAIKESNGLRPSIETSLHALMSQKVVIHVHSINVLSWVVRRDGKSIVTDKLQGLLWEWIDYVRPGLPLTRAVVKALASTPNANVLLLANHGLVVSGESIEEAKILLKEVERRLGQSAQTDMELEKLPLFADSLPAGSRLPANAVIQRLAQNQNFIPWLSGVLYPDHVVFLGSEIPVVSVKNAHSLADVLNAYPYCAAIEGKGVILGNKFSAGAEAMLECLALLVPLLPEKESVRYLTSDEIFELTNWDAEKARVQLTAVSSR
jgi:rhamnose utilization protein RhaD (predicted bifunctional aldolase and dehydrogenase)